MRKSGEFRTASTPGDERRTTATAVETEWLAARGRRRYRTRGKMENGDSLRIVRIGMLLGQKS